MRDIARSGLTDAQLETLFSELPRPFAFDPDVLAYSFRHGWVVVAPPVEIPEPSEVIDEHIDEWIADCDKETLERIRDQITETLKLRSENENGANL